MSLYAAWVIWWLVAIPGTIVAGVFSSIMYEREPRPKIWWGPLIPVAVWVMPIAGHAWATVVLA